MNKANNGANLGFENKLWEMADKMRGHMDAGEYKHVILGLIFLKYISDAFQAKYDELFVRQETDYTDPEDRDEYSAGNIFWVPKEARWDKLQAGAKQPTIGKLIDDAMVTIEKETPTLKGVLPKDYSARRSINTALAHSSILSATLVWATRFRDPRTSSVVFMNIFSVGLPLPRAKAAASFIRRNAWSSC